MRQLTLFILFIIAHALHSQELHFEKKDIQLPSPESYNVSQDKDGYIWIATDLGYCKYDGVTLKIYDAKNGLPENSIYAATTDIQGTVWSATAGNRIFYTVNGEIREAPFSSTFETDKSLAANNHIHRLKVNHKDSTLIVVSLHDTYLVQLKDNSVSKITKDVSESERTIVLERIGTDLIPIKPSKYASLKTIDIIITDSIAAKTQSFKNIDLYTSHLSKIPFTLNFNNTDVIAFANFIFTINRSNELIKKEFPSRILYIHSDKDNGFWIGTLGNGVFYYPDGNLNSTPIHSLKNYSVSGILEDREGNIWATTLENGVYFSRSKYLLSYENVKGMDIAGSLLTKYKDKVYFSSTAGEMDAISYLNIEKIKLPSFLKEVITDIEPFKNQIYIGSKLALITYNESFDKFSGVTEIGNTSDILNIHNVESSEDELYGTVNHWIYQINGNNACLINKMPFYIRDIEYIGHSNWLVGGNSLYICNFKKSEYNFVIDFGFPISDICNVRNNVSLISTKGGGLFQYSNGKVISHKKALGLRTDVIYDITEDKIGNIWLATNQGVVRIASDFKSVKLFTENDGLLSNVVQKILIVKDRIYMSTTNGLCSMPIDAIEKNDHPPQLHITHIYAKGKEINLSLSEPILYKNNTLSFLFDVIYYKSGDIRLVYSLNFNNLVKYKSFFGKEIELQNLNPGKYNLTVWAENQEGEKSNFYQAEFEIAKPLWAKNWFIVIEVGLFASIIAISMYFYTQRIKYKAKKKAEIAGTIASTRLSALQSQMNPHFVFNAINSIQSFVLKKDAKQAYAYLTKFSKLIRLVLQYTRRKLISLDDEMQLIRLYITLEQLRFDNKFDFIEDIDKNIDKEHILVTPMLIQPFLENAVWHGISPLNEQNKGKITLRIFTNINILQIEIEDNGVGRGFNNRKRAGESLAINLTEERLQMVNLIYNTNVAKLEFIDLFDNKLPIGTKIVITLPLLKEE